ncbi:hypothetical protein DdX_15994 [Ditylenchus destructor]|uniref:Uncharacterized protein n=1 Tax=Ditylenchus destructor TaxID=166010 RepID=A0AAD4QUB5_9BILA|nr:hypothetical protein DdX_15994 [Ditylenchus destructor]
MTSSAQNGNLQVLKSRLFRYWYPLPPVYFQWSGKQPRSSAALRICKCRDHVKEEQKIESEDLPEMAGGVTQQTSTEDIPDLQEAARLWRTRMYGSIYRNQ